MSFFSRLKRYMDDPAYRHKRVYERLGNYRTYLADPREIVWKIKAAKEAENLMQDPVLRATEAQARVRFAGTTYDKYVDFQRYLGINLRRVYRLGLDSAAPCRILDIGSGCGFFDWLCRHKGHTVHGLDIPGIPIFDFLIPEFSIPRTEFRMEPGVPMPAFDQRFDCIVSFAICFHELEGGEHWSRDHWQFFLNDIKTNVAAPGARMHLFFNDWPHGDFEEVRSRILPCANVVKQGHKTLEFRF